MTKIKTLKGKQASILGLGNNPQIDSKCFSMAYEAGINYFFFYNFNQINWDTKFQNLLQTQRENLIIATGSESRKNLKLQEYLADVRQKLATDIIDLFFLEYVSPQDDWQQIQALLNELHEWKQKKLIRYVAATTHNRDLALKLLNSGQCEVLMHRYNMAHRKAENLVFPTAKSLHIPIVAFTSTRWASLLNGHAQWQEKIPTAADCYRFNLQNSAIHLTLTSPKTTIELKQNLAVLNNPYLSAEEYLYWQKYGDLIYGDGQDIFETKWL